MRVAAGDMEIRGASIKNGDRVLLWMAAANRDPEKFTSPDTFDVTRSPNPHLTFSHGIHFCMGAPLGGELEIALTHSSALSETRPRRPGGLSPRVLTDRHIGDLCSSPIRRIAQIHRA